MDGFHPIISEWFLGRFEKPSPAQNRGWPLLQNDQNTLIAAPTGSGKTMAAFLVAIDRLLKQALAGELKAELQVVYISPLRALSNDVQKNLQGPLEDIGELVNAKLQRKLDIQVGLRTGDSTPYERTKLLKNPPHILVTTPESLYLLLTSPKGRALLKPVATVIVDEVHALARDKRGSHLSLSLERLDHLVDSPPTRIGLSATMNPMADMVHFLSGQQPCALVDESRKRKLDIAVVLPDSPLSAVCSHDQWAEMFQKLADEVQAHRSTLIFVNTRRMAERVSFHLAELLGEEAVSSHHGSLSKDARFQAEQRLKAGEIKAIVATASLELGIDVGTIDLVCQVGSPRSIGVFMQRIGRSGHAFGLTPKGRLFALTRDELFECYALMQACQEGDLDRVEIPKAPLDILAQQIVAMCSAEEWSVKELFKTVTRSWIYQDLQEDDYLKILEILATGISPRSRRGSYLHYDKVNQRLRAKRHARLSALTSGGAIPEQNLYRVVAGEGETFVGTLDEEFAIESSRGDVFLLGNTSWRVEDVRQGKVRVHDAGGAPPTIPFWFGEAPGRSFELSQHVSKLRSSLDEALPEHYDGDHQDWSLDHQELPQAFAPAALILARICPHSKWAIKQLIHYCAMQKLASGSLPTQEQVIFERFFDDTGGMQLVIHAPFGARINRAWGLAFRKRFCRGFDFELQASADDNGIVLSVGPGQSFPIDALFPMLNAKNCRYLLTQALLDVPMFQIRWRWNITRALAVLRFRGGKKVPPHLQRYQSDDLLTAVFPQQTQCFEHRNGDLEVPDHPYVQQTVTDCLTEAMDIHRFEEIMTAKDEGFIKLRSIDTREPSPFSYELIHANPYAFLDDAPLEERRTRAVQTRRFLEPGHFDELSALDPQAVEQVRQQAWPLVRSADELHEALVQLVVLPEDELGPWQPFLEPLLQGHRAYRFTQDGRHYLCCAEHLTAAQRLFDGAKALSQERLPEALQVELSWEEACRQLVRGHIEVRGPVTGGFLAELLGLAEAHVQAALSQLESEGLVLSGQFTGQDRGEEREWCDRRLLARIHRLTVEGLRERIKPVSAARFMSFLMTHQGCSPQSRLKGESGVLTVSQQLMGYEVPCSAWESELLTARVESYRPSDLDQLCFKGILHWGRLQPPARKDEQKGKGSLMSRLMPLSIFPRQQLSWLSSPERCDHREQLSAGGLRVYEALVGLTAPFFEDLVQAARLPRSAVEEALGELISLGLASADGFAAIRPFIAPDRHRKSNLSRQKSRRRLIFETGFERGGRWSLFPGPLQPPPEEERTENWAWLLLERYGVIFKELLTRERLAPAWFELLKVYRRLEMRGEIRGGRFVRGVAGEQFSLLDAVETLRQVPAEPGPWVVLSACDPLNLVGIIDEGPKVPALPGNRLVYEGGELIAYRDAGEIHFTQDMPQAKQEILKRAIRLNGSFRHQDPFIREYFERQSEDPQGGTKQKAPASHQHLDWSKIVGPG